MTGLEKSADPATIELLARLKDLPVSARVVQSALHATLDADCTSRRLEDILEADAGSAADVLRLANSAYYGVRGEIRTLALAVTVIGHRRLIVLLRHLLAGKLLEVIQPHSEVGRRVRLVALSAAIISSEMARRQMAADPDEMMVAGLLHNVGELALLAEASEEDLPELDKWLADSETEPRITVMGIDSFDAGPWLLQAWGFPSTYSAAARYWVDPEAHVLDPVEREYAAFVHLGAKAGRAWVNGLDSREALNTILDSVFDLTGVEPDDFAAAYDRIEEDILSLDSSL